MIYLCDVTPLLDPVCFAGLLPLVSRERREKITALPPEKEKCRTLAAGLLLRQVCRDYGIRDDTLGYGQQGKPYFEAYRDIHFNLSHSGMRAMCAVDSRPLGCDVQERRKVSPALLKKALSQREYDWCMEQADPEDAFFRLWVRKESYLKATGLGLSQPLDSFSVQLPGEMLFDKGVKYALFGWQEPPYYFALCQQDRLTDQECRMIDLKTQKAEAL